MRRLAGAAIAFLVLSVFARSNAVADEAPLLPGYRDFCQGLLRPETWTLIGIVPWVDKGVVYQFTPDPLHPPSGAASLNTEWKGFITFAGFCSLLDPIFDCLEKMAQTEPVGDPGDCIPRPAWFR